MDSQYYGEKPYKRYKKTILGKVHVVAINPFSEKPEGVILTNEDQDSQIVEVFTPKADRFFHKANKKHFKAGNLIELTKEPEKKEKSPNQITDEEIDELLSKPFLSLKSKLEKFTSEAPVFRLLNRARELEKSDKIIQHITEKLEEIQGILPPVEEEE